MKAVKYNIHSIYTELVVLIVVGFIAAVAVFFICLNGLNEAIENFVEGTSFVENMTEKKMDNLQSYVLDQNIKSNDEDMLKLWIKKNDVYNLLIIKNGEIMYDSSNVIENLTDEESLRDYYKDGGFRTIKFADGAADVFTFGVSLNRLYELVIIFGMLLAFATFFFIVIRGIRRTMRYIKQLNNEIEILESGQLDYPITIKGRDELSNLAMGLDSMRLSFKEQLSYETYLTDTHKKLITEMSHDIRTPLTSLLMYTEILKKKKYKGGGQMDEYLDKLDIKAHQIKRMIDDIFEYSLINCKKDVELDKPKKVRIVFYDIFSEFISVLHEQGFEVECSLDWTDNDIKINEDYLHRVMDNITSNIIKYADAASPIVLSVGKSEKDIFVSVKNKISTHKNVEESTKIGLHNIENMIRGMNGYSKVTEDKNDFSIMLYFPII